MICGRVLWSGVRVAWGGMMLAAAGAATGVLAQGVTKAVVDLPSSKQIVGVAPGNPQRVNSEPVSMAVSPDGRYVVTVNAGYGTFESKYEQSLAVMDTRTGRVVDFDDGQTDLVLGAGVQRGWETSVREHGFADRSGGE